MSKLTLKENPTLADFQAYIKEVVIERGFEQEKLSDIFMLFLEECGELAKAARKNAGIAFDAQSHTHSAGDEAADVFMYLIDICNHLGVDLEKAVREKEEKNKLRTWAK